MAYQQQGYGRDQYQHPPAYQQQFGATNPEKQASMQPQSTESGTFQGGSYHISRHNTNNAILNFDLQQGTSVRSCAGAMLHMSPTITLSGKLNFSMKKLFDLPEAPVSTYTAAQGAGRLALAPRMFGEILTLLIDSSSQWLIGKEAFLASTQDVQKEMKHQGLFFWVRVSGQGLLWLTSFGAVDKVELAAGEQHIFDNGHLLAWNCDFTVEKAGGGTSSSIKTGEGLICRLTGPGTVYLSTRNLDDFGAWVRMKAPS